MKIILFLSTSLLLTACGTASESGRLEIQSACAFLRESISAENEIASQEQQSRSETIRKNAEEDPGLAEAFADNPSIASGFLDWGQHAERMIAMYLRASEMVTEDIDFSAILKDSGYVWASRLAAHKARGATKGELMDKQISLDAREAFENQPYLAKVCE
jgi:hypothetical protein